MIPEILSEAKTKMAKAVDAAKEDFAAVRTGRANPSLFSGLLVEYYGTPTPLQQLASFQNPEARTLLITPYDRSALNDIEKALRNSDVGANPANDGNVIRVVMPELTEERRKEYVKIVGHKAEEARVSVRNIRRHAKDQVEKLVKDGEIGEDEGKRAEKDLDGSTRKHIEQIDELLKNKEAELLQV
ncbi:ribosome-recycling factor [Kocuria flava]|uniref:Ribosome-recycling factor n=1 Tax=Kocuria flava TaxID=446860 RepID=A0A0U2WTL4_9MICC|nr:MULTISPECIES: ribosome recycling factor [Kocuria]ALU39748.1 ribosome-recycling factor [Kocuria flava]MCD1145074.1 ribosome recycling factor [Kocuria sp. LUK]GEO92544.1 ribosome-recycling factor [Kocuria flava]